MSIRRAAAQSFDDAPVAGSPGDGDDGDGRGPLNGDAVFKGCPVTPLGYDGDVYFYLDIADQLRAVDNHSREKIASLFGGKTDILREPFPQYGKATDDEGKPKVIGWKQDTCRDALMRACLQRGKWSAMARVRGVGAWPAEDDGRPPILHCGDVVIVEGEALRPGMIGERVYPAGVRQPRPWHDPVRGPGGPGEELLRVLRTWALSRGEADAKLLLGWVCCAMFGGALTWRPMIWITGGAGSGKSMMDKLLAAVLGGETAVVQSSDASEPAIRQALGLASLPVLLDELESEAEGARAKAVIKLARQAASQGVILRGSADNKTVSEFKAQSCFKFSSILIPSMGDQDTSRLCVVELRPLPRDAVAPRIDRRSWGLVGRRLRRRILDEWPRWETTHERYRAALARAGHDARGCDQFGALLAMADMALMEGEPDTDSVEAAIVDITADRIAQRSDKHADWERCLRFLGSQTTTRHINGAHVTLAELVAAAADMTDGEPLGPREANRELGRYGMRVMGRRKTATLMIANTHDGLRRLFAHSKWATEPSQTGVWSQDVRRTPGARASSSANSFGGVPSRSWTIPIEAFLGDEEPEPAATDLDVVWEG